MENQDIHRVATYQDLIDFLAIKPNPLDQEGVSGLTVECHPNPGWGFLFTFLALTYTHTDGLIMCKRTQCVTGALWEGVLPCQPSFIRSQIAGVEQAGLWEQDHYQPPPPEELMMCDPTTYLLRIKDVQRGREQIICMLDSDLALEQSVRKLNRAITSLIDRTRRGFVWRSRLHSLIVAR